MMRRGVPSAVGFLALVAVLTLAGETRAQDPKNKPVPPKPPVKKPAPQKPPAKAVLGSAVVKPGPAKKVSNEAAKAGLKFEEVEALRRAYVLLAVANHDFGGHRARAMHAVHAAGKILNIEIMKTGNVAQKQATLFENAKTTRAAEIDVGLPALHENQRISNVQLAEAAQLLLQVRTVLAQHKQQKPLGNVDLAIKEIRTGLAITR
jgi:hypothetical protein